METDFKKRTSKNEAGEYTEQTLLLLSALLYLCKLDLLQDMANTFCPTLSVSVSIEQVDILAKPKSQEADAEAQS